MVRSLARRGQLEAFASQLGNDLPRDLDCCGIAFKRKGHRVERRLTVGNECH
jgi:hypothetical protein